LYRHKDSRNKALPPRRSACGFNGFTESLLRRKRSRCGYTQAEHKKRADSPKFSARRRRLDRIRRGPPVFAVLAHALLSADLTMAVYTHST
jgi:hypothetical protein